jgi:protein kinase/serine/threonine-protein kinase
MSALENFITELKSRNVRRTLAIYMSSALTTIGIVKLFVDVYKVPEQVFPIIVTVLTCGLVSAFLFAWYHGKEDSRGFRKREVLLHSLVLIVAVMISVRVGSDPRTKHPLSADKSIAVLPFKNMSASKEDEYFSDGITEDILTQLSRIEDLSVISRTSSIRYRNTDKTSREIARELGVAAILEGSVRRSGDRVRIDGRLVNASLDRQIWAGQYDREFKDIFAIQSEVAQKIAEALKAHLSPDERQLIEKRATLNLDAYAYFLQGRNYYYQLTKDDNERAIGLFKKAIGLDSAYALAFAGLADAYAQRYQRYGFAREWIDSSIVLSQHAIDLDPELPEPYKSLGLAYYQKEWYEKAMALHRKALDLNPNFASAYSNMGELLDWTGHQDEAVALIKKAIQLQPGRASDHIKLGSVYYSLGLDSLSVMQLKKAIELQPSITNAYATLSELYTRQGNVNRARALLDSVLTGNPDDPVLLVGAGYVELYDRKYERALRYFQRVYTTAQDFFGLLTPLGFTLLKTGRVAEGEKVLEFSMRENLKSIRELSEEGSRRYDLARVYAIRRDSTSALKWLADAVARGSGIYRYTERDPMLEALLTSHEFKRLIGIINSRAEEMRARVVEGPL